MAKQGCAAHEIAVEPRPPWGSASLRADRDASLGMSLPLWASGEVLRTAPQRAAARPSFLRTSVISWKSFQARIGPLKLITHASVTPTRACAPGRAQNASREALNGSSGAGVTG